MSEGVEGTFLGTFPRVKTQFRLMRAASSLPTVCMAVPLPVGLRWDICAAFHHWNGRHTDARPEPVCEACRSVGCCAIQKWPCSFMLASQTVDFPIPAGLYGVRSVAARCAPQADKGVNAHGVWGLVSITGHGSIKTI